jgi:hypothetical protein
VNGGARVTALAPNLTVEIKLNPRSTPCLCGTGHWSTWQIVASDGRKVPCCGGCVERIWRAERLF